MQWKWWREVFRGALSDHSILIRKFMYPSFHFSYLRLGTFVCVCTWAPRFVGTHVCTWSLRVISSILLLHCSSPYPPRQVSQSNPELLDMASLAWQLAVMMPSLPFQAGMTGGLQCPSVLVWVLGTQLWSSRLFSKHFNYKHLPNSL